MKYEIFISFKRSDEYGNKTKDYEIAKELYDDLVSLGYTVFFSSNSLESLGSSRYKADIDEALDEAKVMIVVLTRAEYAVSHWVQYEWDSFYNDFLSGVRSKANLFTLTQDINVNDLPRTLRNVQNFNYSEGVSRVCDYIKNVIPCKQVQPSLTVASEEKSKRIKIISGKQVTAEDIKQAVDLDALVYDDIYHVDSTVCEEWFEVNPDIYFMAKDISSDKVIAYVNISPVTEECYDRIKKGDFIDTGITADMILNYDMPFPYSLYFSSIVIHPNYHNTEVFMELFNAIIDKFILLGEHEVYVKRMVADAVTKNGEKFCKLFGMEKIKGSNHGSSLYEITMIPPKFRMLSKKTKQLFDYYKKKYEESPYLFENDDN